MNRPDSGLLHEETQGVLKKAMLHYPGDPLHVAVFILSIVLDWNDLQILLSRTDQLTSSPQRVSRICSAVDEHLEDRLRTYLDIGPSQ